jgi:hypothetical protein
VTITSNRPASGKAEASIGNPQSKDPYSTPDNPFLKGIRVERYLAAEIYTNHRDQECATGKQWWTNQGSHQLEILLAQRISCTYGQPERTRQKGRLQFFPDVDQDERDLF